MALTITHTHEQGTLIAGTCRGDGSAEVLKAVVNPRTGRRRPWRWSANLGSWYVQRSRDCLADGPLICATRDALLAGGFDGEVQVDDTYRSTAEVEGGKVARQAVRVQALDAVSIRKAAAAEAAENRSSELAASMPLGQPILVDHYSASTMRRASEKIENAAHQSLAAHAEARAATVKAEAAQRTTAVRYSPGVIRRRIEALGQELRRHKRARDGYSRTLFVDGHGVKHVETVGAAAGEARGALEVEIARVSDEIAYWRNELSGASAAGAQLWDAATVEVGDVIRYAGGSGTVSRSTRNQFA